MNHPPSTLQIIEVDPDDDEGFARFHATYHRAQSHGLEGIVPVWTLEELRVTFQSPNRRRAHLGFAGTLHGAVVCTGYLGTSLMDNLDTATVVLEVLPEHRRCGWGSQMLAHLEARAAELGRTRLEGEAAWPSEHGSDGSGWAGREFAVAHDYALALGDVQRELALPVAEDLLDELAEQAAPYHRDYELRSWVGDIPEEMAHSWMTLSSSLMTEAPTGDKEIEPEVVDVAALREGEAQIAAQGRTRFNTVALDATGDVVAYTDMVSTIHEPGKVYQWGTLVRTADRGHRLGTAVKVANLRLLQGNDSTLDRVITWNAEVNIHMIGVNEQLGFRPVARLGEFQKRLS